MYHIFLSLLLTASQHQINQTEHYLAQQKNSQTRAAQVVSDNSKQDIIAQLTKEKELEEAAIKPDLESLGLDQVDSSPKIISTPIPDKQKDVVSKDIMVAKNLSNVEIVKGDKLAIKTEVMPSSEIPLSPKNESPTIDKIEPKKDSTNDSLDKNPEEINNPPEENGNKKILEMAAKPINKIKELFGKKSNDEPLKNPSKESVGNDEKKALNDEPLKKPSKESAGADKQKASNSKIKYQERIEERRKKQIALTELKQKQRTEKLENLRQKYLQQGEGEGNVYEGINRYQAISAIIPKQKILPKFMNSEVPPPLLNRFRVEENKHHPVIISNSEKVNFMFKAIAENKIDEFNALYSLVKDPNIKNSSGDTLLTFAVLMRRHDVVSSVLSKGANPDLANELGYTPLNIAIEMVDYESASTLIDMGAKVNLVDDLGRTYLMQSSRVGSLQITDLLISNGVDINISDRNGTTALAIAYKHKKDIIAKYLLKYGAKSWIKKGYSDDDTSVIEDLFDKWK